MPVAPAPVAQLYPTPRVSNGLSDCYIDILGGEPVQDNIAGTQTTLNAGGISAVLTVSAGGVTGKQVIIPAAWFGGNVTWIRGLYALSATPRYTGFMADFSSGDTTNYADFTQKASNNYAGGVLSTTVPVLASVAINTQLQAYYSYRSGPITAKGQSMSGWPQLHVDPYQATANDGDNYLMMALYHAYLTTRNPKYKALADRIGTALLDAGRWDSNDITFDIPFNAEEGQVGFYSYNASTTPFAYGNVPIGLNVQTTVLPGGPPYNYAGFGMWPTIPITAYSPFNSLDITLLGDGSKRNLLVNLNTDPAHASSGDYFCKINMIPQDAYSATLFSMAQSDFWKTGNVVYDSGHRDYAYSGTYGSNVALISDYIDVPNKRVIKQFQYDYTGNVGGYAGWYFGPASNSSAGTTALNFKFYADNAGIGRFIAQDSASVQHAVWAKFQKGWNTFTIPWIGSIATAPPVYIQYAGLIIGANVAGFSQTTFAHPATQFYFEGASQTLTDYNTFITLLNAGVPYISTAVNVYVPPYYFINFVTRNAVMFDQVTYDAIQSMQGTSPTLLNGVQIAFPTDPAAYNVSFASIRFNMGIQDGPTSDPTRYMGITRWTYKWVMSNGYIGYGSWRGPSAPGYNWLAGWYHSGIVNPDNGRVVSLAMLDFMTDAQAAYTAQFPALMAGPFMTKYGRPSWEALTTQGYVAGALTPNTYNKWYVPDIDNWYGYMNRALLAVAQYYFYSGSAQAKAILDSWMAWLNVNILPDGAYWWPPSEFDTSGVPRYGYKPVYAYATIAAACIYKYWVDADTLALTWYRRMLDDIFARQRQTVTGQLAGIYPTAEGQNYTTASVVFTCDGTAPTVTPFITGGKITHYDVVTAGSGMTYCSATISGDGSGATGNAYLSDDLVGAFSSSPAGWEAAEILNTYALLVNGPPAGGIVNHTLTASSNDLVAYNGLLAFYQRTSRNSRPSMQTANWIPVHEYRVDPYHNGSAIENPMIRDTHARGATWTETVAPTLWAAVEYLRFSGDGSWLDTLYSLVVEYTGTYGGNAMAVFPTLAGLTWNSKKSPTFNTQTHRAASGYEVRASLMQYPLWQFSLTYEFLRDNAANNELKTLMGFFLNRKGSFDSFLYTDPADSSVTAQNFGTGDGVTLGFQLIRAYGGFVEPVQNLNGNPSIYINGVLKTLTTDYSISATGLVTFVAAPAAAAAITCDMSYYYRVRFLADKSEFNQFMFNLYELKQLEFIGSPMNKV